MTTKRSRLLTHWTGKDIEADVGQLDDAKRKAYVDRLSSVLHYGFWMNRCGEELSAVLADNQTWTLKYDTPATCFTELRLSSSARHIGHYGLLGIVVDRSFVLDRWGAPFTTFGQVAVTPWSQIW